jgi:hypothetical protein
VDISSFQDRQLVTEGGNLETKAPPDAFWDQKRMHLLRELRLKNEGKTKN